MLFFHFARVAVASKSGVDAKYHYVPRLGYGYVRSIDGYY